MTLNITREEVALPPDQRDHLAFLLHNVLSAEECEDYIKWTEERGYTKALLSVGGGRQKLDPHVCNSDHCIIDSPEEANKLWQRIRAYVPTRWMGCPVKGLNERLRFLRYDAGQFFKPHMDAQYVAESGKQSYITLLIYLNEGFEGGHTIFLPQHETKSKEGRHIVHHLPAPQVVPVTGSALIFQHDLLNEESVVTSGRKYAVRTDVMYAAGLPMRIKVRT
ncbi:hypothetical protein BaRGS_00023002 [Batillaria attramentaria]|uniref:Prolyl 4-hydroxylase alpha subunit domain-containing protein n=1 Tax=Batillaria attramentaria TaxID=370345 RepID=A0ABD0KF06_9CAEN